MQINNVLKNLAKEKTFEKKCYHQTTKCKQCQNTENKRIIIFLKFWFSLFSKPITNLLFNRVC